MILIRNNKEMIDNLTSSSKNIQAANKLCLKIFNKKDKNIDIYNYKKSLHYFGYQGLKNYPNWKKIFPNILLSKENLEIIYCLGILKKVYKEDIEEDDSTSLKNVLGGILWVMAFYLQNPIGENILYQNLIKDIANDIEFICEKLEDLEDSKYIENLEVSLLEENLKRLRSYYYIFLYITKYYKY